MSIHDLSGTDVFCDRLIELARDLPIVLLSMDSAGGVNGKKFEAAHGGRYIECGIAEANAVCVGAGLSATGHIPVAHTHAPFITRRVMDQLVISVAYSGLNIKIIGTTPGIYSQANGGTHLGIEDIALIRSIPRFKVIDACDNVAIDRMLPAIMADPDPVYLRFSRCCESPVYEEDASFTIGKANKLLDGEDLTIFANGLMVQFALRAAAKLKEEGIGACVYDMHTVKPIDQEAVMQAQTRGSGVIIAAENSTVVNGLGSAVAEVMAESALGGRLVRFGIRDRFGVVGDLTSICEELGITWQDLYLAAKSALGA
ncbi:MAG: transketolase family protein [Christensenellales bacterium]|jgi:transketolase